MPASCRSARPGQRSHRPGTRSVSPDRRTVWDAAVVTPCPVVRSEACLLHVPGAEIWVGVRTPGTEVAERAVRIESVLRAAGHPVADGVPHDDDVLLRVHDPRLVEHLRTVYARWVQAGFLATPGQDRVVPYLVPSAGMLDGLPEREPTAVHAAAGRWCYDTMTLVGPGTWEAARGAVDVTLTAVDARGPGGNRWRTRSTRPPGHHVTQAAYGGSCYLNNAAVAAAGAARRGARPGRRRRHRRAPRQRHAGRLLRPRRRVLRLASTSTPAPAGSRTTPASPTRPGAAPAAAPTATSRSRRGHRRRRLAGGAATGSPDAVAAYGAGALVVSLGVDAALDDPESPAAGDRTTATSAPAGASPRWGCRRSRCRRAATTSTRSASLVAATLRGLAAG